LQLPDVAVEHASRILEQHRYDLMWRPGVLGSGVGASDSGGEAAIIVYVDNTASARPQLPTQIDGVPVRVQFTDPFVAF
jgi:hypothetical protein